MTLAGLAAGALATPLLPRLLGNLVYGVSPTLAVTAIVRPAAALLAWWLPARRAARASPMAALRVE